MNRFQTLCFTLLPFTEIGDKSIFEQFKCATFTTYKAWT